MMDRIYKYTLIDTDDEDPLPPSKIEFVHRSCRCLSPGCVDDEIRIHEEGEENPYTLQVPRLMTPILEGLFDGTYRLEKVYYDSSGRDLAKEVK